MSDMISAFLQQRVDGNDFPSAVYLVAEKGDIVYSGAVGRAVVEPEELPARIGTIYDAASLTKPLVTGLLAAILLDRGAVRADQALAALLPDLAGAVAGKVTVEQLLTHTSGLPAWLPFYLLVDEPSGIIPWISSIEPDAAPDVVYSDLNFILLAAVIERQFGRPLGQVFADEAASPLGLADTCFNPPSERKGEIAASEAGNAYEKQTCVEKFPHLSLRSGVFREGTIWGEVHDGNAYFMGGEAGHAGLFSTAADISTIAHQFLPGRSRLLRPETCELFQRNFTNGRSEDRSFAFQLASTVGSTAGSTIPPESFGHNGFTGTSLWIDPVNERVFVLLTNRTHHHPLPFVNINAVRRRFHDLAAAALDER